MIAALKKHEIKEASEEYKSFAQIEKIANVDSKPGYKKKFIFKELNEKIELWQMFALRYLVYRYVNFIEPNKHQLDIDCYDFFSTFLGVFEVTNQRKRLVGTVRIISGDNKSPCADLIKDIINNLDGHRISELADKPTLFPIMHTYDIPEEYLRDFSVDNNPLQIENSKPFEISRLAILPEYWCVKEGIEDGIHELILLDAWESNPNKNIYFIATHPRTRKKYERLGFKIVPGTSERLYKHIKQLAIAMVLNLENYIKKPNPYSERCKAIFKSYLKKGYFERK